MKVKDNVDAVLALMAKHKEEALPICDKLLGIVEGERHLVACIGIGMGLATIIARTSTSEKIAHAMMDATYVFALDGLMECIDSNLCAWQEPVEKEH